jgi:mono/diheme cytochrome c family protein
MKKLLLIVGIIAMNVCLLVSCVSRKAEPLKQEAFVPANESIANGERVYMANCQKCHPAGEGGLGPSVNANPAPQLIKRFQMRHGLGVMPAFSTAEISRSDLHDISKYLRAWKTY